MSSLPPKSLLFKSSLSPKKPLKKPNQFVNKLNQDIQTIQSSIIHYNQIEINSRNWKQQLNFPNYSCQLKTLSQPKLQNILLESNFINNIAIFGKNINQSAVKNSTIKLKNSKHKNFMLNSSGIAFRKTMSMKVDGSYNNKKLNNQNNMRKSQKSLGINNQTKIKPDFIQQNPELSFVETRPQFLSFREPISKNESFKRIESKKGSNKRIQTKGNVSEMSAMGKTLDKCPSKNLQSDSTMFDEFIMKDNETLIEDEAQSIMMQTSTRLFSQEFQNTKNKSFLNSNNNYSKQLGLIPISEEKTITLPSQRKGKTIRQQIQQKTIKLQKQWVLTECYRQKFNIAPTISRQQSRITQTSQNKGKRSSNKLANIIQKVQERRPSTSLTYQRTQNSRQTTLTEQNIKEKSKTLQNPQFNNESIQLNISTFAF